TREVRRAARDLAHRALQRVGRRRRRGAVTRMSEGVEAGARSIIARHRKHTYGADVDMEKFSRWKRFSQLDEGPRLRRVGRAGPVSVRVWPAATGACSA